jgi:prepilin-type N-terminal cleavage/methylation domain-containing protein
MSARLGDERGLTLMELMIALALTAIASAVVDTIFVSTQGNFASTRGVTERQQDARVVIGLISQDVRSAGSDVLGIGIERMAIAAADTLRIQSDLDGNGVIDALTEPAEDVTWFFDAGSGNLVRRTAAGDAAILRNVTDFRLRYLDAAGAPLAALPLVAGDRARVRAVTLDLSLRIDRNTERTWVNTVALRNDAADN